ncbi:hypothetical protein HHK36_018781 [Tetracentron sinense]|uniref:ADP/ATP translocase n=1 Tax=Tetracentron sinense TaxID=13715 RepID=A0A834YSV8_TETSI|nr:hypothetical protein HHK36_018781 [Tetracentron sinense]
MSPSSPYKNSAESPMGKETTGNPLLMLSRLSSGSYMEAFYFAFKGYFQSIFGCSQEKRWMCYVVGCKCGLTASGSGAKATGFLFLYHLDYACTLLDTDVKECLANDLRQFKGLLDVYRKTLSSKGFVGELLCQFPVGLASYKSSGVCA